MAGSGVLHETVTAGTISLLMMIAVLLLVFLTERIIIGHDRRDRFGRRTRHEAAPLTACMPAVLIDPSVRLSACRRTI